MDRIELLVAHIDEALTFAASSEVSKRRLALLLLDSAAELMMYRETQSILSREQITRQLVDMMDRTEQLGRQMTAEERRQREEYRSSLTTTKQRREINRLFDAKAAHLQREGLLAPAHARVLQKLHKYRNETYHRDHLRVATLDSALRVYIHIVCEMLRAFPVRGIGSSRYGSSFPVITKYLGEGYAWFFDVNEHIAQAMLAQQGMDTDISLGADLSAHLATRFEEFDESRGFIADWLSSIRGDGPWSSPDVLYFVQVEDGQLPPRATRQMVLATSPAVTEDVVVEWQHMAKLLAVETDHIRAFSLFADLEDAFEPVEDRVRDVAMSIDEAIQHEIDVARGK